MILKFETFFWTYFLNSQKPAFSCSPSNSRNCRKTIVMSIKCVVYRCLNYLLYHNCRGFPGGSVQRIPTNAGEAGDLDLILGSGIFLGIGNGNPFRYSWFQASHGKRRLVGYSSPCGHKESNVTEQLNTHHKCGIKKC